MSFQEYPFILGTAGHIDHGKTALVRALSGIECDRLSEEKKRGMTIELGFAPLVLPSGKTISIVDVPGHEKFIRQMVAGAAGIDAVMLVVAADDGVMPQTKEHLEILTLLGIKNGITVLNTPGTIDADYRGEIGVILVNLSAESFTVNDGDRIAQMVIAKHETAIWDEVDELSETDRGAGGFGSTSK